MTSRRHLIHQSIAAAAGATLLLRLVPAEATPESLQQAIASFSGDAPIRTGRVKLQIAELVENGNAVPVTVSVDSPMSAGDFVRRIALFNERNPQPEVAVFELSPANGRAEVGTRIRLATSQGVVAVAQMNDGSLWQQRVDVIVTLAACIEGG
ncbi:SoxY-related AACIE arm protein [Piscinibacter sakaiensis]|uniref:SoxY-related AACIE arm protein n=1 Tax=Piscinibacter sakaiensis TaxID=1547922 RepID=UPI003AAFE7CD